MEGAAKLLAGQADAIRAQVLRHSTENFMQRLAARIGADARSPAPVGYAPAGSAAMALDPYPAESGDIARLSPPDPLAAHLLAAHHAAIGPTTDSRAWIAFSVMLGFCPDRHVPRPVRHRAGLAGSFTSEIPTSDAARSFLRHRNLPPDLARL